MSHDHRHRPATACRNLPPTRCAAHFLRAHGVEQLAITDGWGCVTHPIEQPLAYTRKARIPWLHKDIAQGIYHLGEDNLYLEANAPRWKLTLCHDADIHFQPDSHTKSSFVGRVGAARRH